MSRRTIKARQLCGYSLSIKLLQVSSFVFVVVVVVVVVDVVVVVVGWFLVLFCLFHFVLLLLCLFVLLFSFHDRQLSHKCNSDHHQKRVINKAVIIYGTHYSGVLLYYKILNKPPRPRNEWTSFPVLHQEKIDKSWAGCSRRKHNDQIKGLFRIYVAICLLSMVCLLLAM